MQYNNFKAACASILITTATNLYPPPDTLCLADAQPGTLVFSWTAVLTNCSTLQYIITSNCGTCSILTNSNATTAAAICSDFQLTTSASLCNFRVSSHACSLTGNPSLPIVVKLKGNYFGIGYTNALQAILFSFL